MKIIVISDTHGEISAAVRILQAEKPDLLLHLGDYIRDAEDLERIFPTLPLCAVPGNNDWFSHEPKERVIRPEGVGIFFCHGHTTNVRASLINQKLKAQQENCTLSLFGHTHSPYLEKSGKIWMFNPGSLTYSDTYGRIELKNGAEPKLEIVTDR